jgi:hypothetical protein
MAKYQITTPAGATVDLSAIFMSDSSTPTSIFNNSFMGANYNFETISSGETFSLVTNTIGYNSTTNPINWSNYRGHYQIFYNTTYTDMVPTSYNINAPPGCTNVTGLIIGGGGAGGNSNVGGGGDGSMGAGGGCIAFNNRFINPLSLTNTIGVQVGNGGAAGNQSSYYSANSSYFCGNSGSYTNGLTGGTSIVSFIDSLNQYIAYGGTGGSGNGYSLNPGGTTAYPINSTYGTVLFRQNGESTNNGSRNNTGGRSGFYVSLNNPSYTIPYYFNNISLSTSNNNLPVGTVNNYKLTYGISINLSNGVPIGNSTNYTSTNTWVTPSSSDSQNYLYGTYGTGGYQGTRGSGTTFPGFPPYGVDYGPGAAGGPGIVVLFYKYD